jgi:hypothetical protein
MACTGAGFFLLVKRFHITPSAYSFVTTAGLQNLQECTSYGTTATRIPTPDSDTSIASFILSKGKR